MSFPPIFQRVLDRSRIFPFPPEILNKTKKPKAPKAEPSLSSSTHPELATRDTSISWASDSVLEEDEIPPFRCNVGAVYHPSNFFINPIKTWNTLEVLQKELGMYYNGNEKMPAAKDDDYFKPQIEDVVPELFVAVYHKNEWHRGLILKVNKKKTKFTVSIIDYGDHQVHSFDKIRFIPVGFLEKIPAQGIRCKLFFVDEAKNKFHDKKMYWTKTEADIFLKLLCGHEFQATFVRYEANMSLCNPIIWHVKLHQLKKDEKGAKNVYGESIDQRFLSALKAKFEKQEKERLTSSADNPETKKRPKDERPFNQRHSDIFPGIHDFPGKYRISEIRWKPHHYDIQHFHKVPLDQAGINVPLSQFKGLLLHNKAENKK